MSVLESLKQRNSHARLAEPGPDAEALQCILRAGLRAPDHGRLRPWRFCVIEGASRDRLGTILANGLQLRDPSVDAAALQKAQSAPLRAPTIIAGLLQAQEHPKVPRVEQVAAVASALYGMSLAANALGFGAIWRTGAYARDPIVITALGGSPSDEIIGFLYVGTREGPSKLIQEEELDQFVSYL